MDNEQKTPSAESLRQMPYSELKKFAKQRGIKGNLKAEKIIAALTLAESDDTDSFSTPAAKVMNSSHKKKVEKFDEDSMTPLVTPRRGTYSIGSPIVLKQNEISPLSVVNESSVLDISNVTVGRGSERKLRSCKQIETSPSSEVNELSVLDASANVITGKGSEKKLRNFQQNETSPFLLASESSVLDVSNVTVGRGSERKRGRKVSFLSPVLTPRTPRNSTLKMRPKTPIVSRTPLASTISLPQLKVLKVNLGERVNTSLHLTSLPEIISDQPDIESLSFMASKEESAEKEQNDAPKSSSFMASKTEENDEPKSTSVLIDSEVSVKKKTISTPRLTRSLVNKNELAKKRLATPNFKKIHEKAFEKMESIEDYQKRIVNSAKKMGVFNFKGNKVTKAKSKIPAFGGIPFIPSKSSAAKWEVSTTLNKSKQMEGKRQPIKKDVENVNTRSKTKFDLKASLSRKLGYKPYTGKLKPLTPSTLLNTSTVACVHKNKDTPAKALINKVVTTKRRENRSILRGVRTNKRFELQMKNRMLQ